MSRRMINPGVHGMDFAARQQEWKPLRELVEDTHDRGRYGEEGARLDPGWIHETLPYATRENVSSAGDAVYSMRTITPTAATTYATTASFDHPMPGAGFVTVGRLWASEARTGGTATLRVRISHGGVVVDYDLSEVVLDGGVAVDGLTTRDDKAADMFPIGQGVPFEAGATISTLIVAAGTFGPATIDISAQLSVVYKRS